MPSWGSLLQLTLFAVAATFTPGPNALLLTSVAARYGLRPAIPAAVGVWAGIPMLIVVAGAGLDEAIHAVDHARLALRVAATVYLLWLSRAVLRMQPPRAGAQAPERQPPSALQAAALQWVNPKAWTMAVGAAGAIPAAGAGSMVPAAVAGAVFGIVLLPAVVMWTAFGSAVRRWLTSERRFRAFTVFMGSLLIASAALTWISE